MSHGDERFDDVGGRNDGDYDYGFAYGAGGAGERRQTRFRLPGGEDDSFESGTGGPRGGRGGRGGSRAGASRSMMAVVGIVVVLIAAIAFATRGGGGGGSGDGESKGGSGTEPTAPSGERPVEGKNGGIPAGFAKTEQGAQSAAANYAVVLVSDDILKPDKRHEIVDRLFVPAKVDALQSRFDKTYSKDLLDKLGLNENGEAPKGMTYISRTSPMGTKLTDFSDKAATLEVWCTGVYGTAGERSTNPVTSDWFTLNLKLRWDNGDWKVESFSQKAGPTPVNGDERASAADEMAKAVDEFGGFTYAR